MKGWVITLVFNSATNVQITLKIKKSPDYAGTNVATRIIIVYNSDQKFIVSKNGIFSPLSFLTFCFTC